MLHLLLPLPYLFQCLGTIFILVSTKIFKNSVSIHSLFTARSPTTRSVKLTITACFCSAFIFRQYTAPKYPPRFRLASLFPPQRLRKGPMSCISICLFFSPSSSSPMGQRAEPDSGDRSGDMLSVWVVLRRETLY